MPITLQDLRLAARRLGKSPGFTAIAMLTLAVGIGANVALFGVIDQIVLRTLPVERPEELVVLHDDGPFRGRISLSSNFSSAFSYPMYQALREASPVTTDMVARLPAALSVALGDSTERVDGEVVSGNYFEMLGVRPALGRLFTAEDDRVKNGHPVVVLSHAAWQTRLGADPSVVGRKIGVNGQPMTVIGVVGPGFRSVQVGAAPEVFLTMAMKPAATPGWDDLDRRTSRWLDIVARLKPGVSREQAQEALQTVYRPQLELDLQSWEEAPSPERRARFMAKKLELLPGARGRSDLRGAFATSVGALFAMVALILLIVCANLANFLAARATARRRELAVRLALGASRWQVAKGFLLESILLALAGGVLGTVLAVALTEASVRWLPIDGLREAFSAGFDPRLLAFAIGLSLVTGALFGLLPALSAARADVAPRLREDAAGSLGGRGARRIQGGLVAGQVALSTVVLIGAALFSRSMARLLDIDPGFRAESVLAFSIDPSLNGYTPEEARAVLLRVEREVAALPGVLGVGMSDTPFVTSSSSSSSVEIEGREPAEGEAINPRHASVTPGFLDAFQLPLLAGRKFTDADEVGTGKVAIVNRKFAEDHFGGGGGAPGGTDIGGAIGRRFQLGREDGWVEIVGVASDMAWARLRDERGITFFQPFRQAFTGYQAMTFYARTAGPPAALAPAIRAVVAAADPQLPVYELRPLAEQLRLDLFLERAASTLALGFAALATFLAGLGLYAVLAVTVAQRTRELGVRMALGAARRDIGRLIFGDGFKPVAWGLALGFGLALPASRLVKSLLYGVAPSDPVALLAAPPVLVLAALAACWLPAHRAARVEPIAALRDE